MLIPGDIVIIDNPGSHKGATVRRTCAPSVLNEWRKARQARATFPIGATILSRQSVRYSVDGGPASRILCSSRVSLPKGVLPWDRRAAP